MLCTSCGTQIRKWAKFCPWCWEKVSNAKNNTEQAKSWESSGTGVKINLDKVLTFFGAFIWVFSFFIFWLVSGIILWVIYLSSWGLWLYIAGKTNKWFFDKLINWSNVYLGIILPPLWVFSASYSHSKYKLGLWKNYLYLSIWSIVISSINLIWWTLLNINPEYSEESFYKHLGISLVLALTSTFRESDSKNVENDVPQKEKEKVKSVKSEPDIHDKVRKILGYTLLCLVLASITFGLSIYFFQWLFG